MAVSLSPFAGAGWQFFDNNGVILSGGKLYTYAAGTTSLATTYTSSTGSTANTNPIILNSSGRLANEIWLTTGLNYKFILKTSSDVLIGTWDNIPAGTTDVADLQAALASSTGAGMIGYIQGSSGSVATTVQTKLRETVSVKDFGAVGDGVTDDTTAIQAALNSGAKTVNFPSGTYKITATLNVSSNTKIVGSSATVVCSVTIAFQALAQSNISIIGMEIQGPGAAVVPAVPEDGGINFGNITSTNGCTNTLVQNCTIHGFYTGVSARYGSGAKLFDSEVYDFSLYGVMLSRNDGFNVSRNYIHGSIVSTGTNSYCISATGGSGSGDTQIQCTVSNNRLCDAPAWSAFMSHDIASLLFTNNIVTNTRNGIDVTAASGTSLRNIVISGNYFEGTTTDTWSAANAANTGVFIATGGAIGTDTVANVTINGNLIYGFGRFTNSVQGVGGILLSNGYNVSVTGNTIVQVDGVNTYVAGIFIASTNYNHAISGNVIRSENTKPCVWAYNSTTDNLSITGNVFSHSNAASTAAKVRIESCTINGLGVEANTVDQGKTGYAEVGTNVIDGVSIAAPYGGRGVAKKISQRFQGASVTGLAAGSTATLGNITMPDVVVGDTVSVGYAGASAGVIVYGYVTGANSVRVELYNGTGASLTKAAATVSVDAWKHS